jgi:hypothetical protein
MDMMDGSPPIPENKRSRSSADGLSLTQSERASVIHNNVNAKYDASYSKSENDRKLLVRHLTPGTACGIFSVELYWAEIPLKSPLCVVDINYVSHILHIVTVFVMCWPLRSLASR